MRMGSKSSSLSTGWGSDDSSSLKIDGNNNIAQVARANSATKLMQSEWPSTLSGGNLVDSHPTKNTDLGGDIMATCVEEDGAGSGSWTRQEVVPTPKAVGKVGDVGMLPTIVSTSVASVDGSVSRATLAGSPLSQAAPPARAGVVGSNEGLTAAEVARHSSADDAWVVLDGVVYDLTRYLANHPGGAKVILAGAGKDCTEEWKSIHPHGLDLAATDYKIGRLVAARVGKGLETGHKLAVLPVGSSKAVECAFAGEQWVECTVETKIATSRNCFEMRIRLPSNKHVRGFKVGGHVVLSTEHEGKKVREPCLLHPLFPLSFW